MATGGAGDWPGFLGPPSTAENCSIARLSIDLLPLINLMDSFPNNWQESIIPKNVHFTIKTVKS